MRQAQEKWYLCRVRAVESDTDLTEEELEEKMEQFMRSQADRESGKLLRRLCCSPSSLKHCMAASDRIIEMLSMVLTGGAVASPDILPDKVIGEDQVTEQVHTKHRRVETHAMLTRNQMYVI